MTSTGLGHRRGNARRPPVCKKVPDPPPPPIPLYDRVEISAILRYKPNPMAPELELIVPRHPIHEIPGTPTHWAGAYLSALLETAETVTFNPTTGLADITFAIIYHANANGTARAEDVTTNRFPPANFWNGIDLTGNLTRATGGLLINP